MSVKLARMGLDIHWHSKAKDDRTQKGLELRSVQKCYVAVTLQDSLQQGALALEQPADNQFTRAFQSHAAEHRNRLML